ncbi:MAG: hypothetical protein AAFU83_02340 [Bacteroidota bacterium]
MVRIKVERHPKNEPPNLLLVPPPSELYLQLVVGVVVREEGMDLVLAVGRVRAPVGLEGAQLLKDIVTIVGVLTSKTTVLTSPWDCLKRQPKNYG